MKSLSLFNICLFLLLFNHCLAKSLTQNVFINQRVIRSEPTDDDSEDAADDKTTEDTVTDASEEKPDDKDDETDKDNDDKDDDKDDNDSGEDDVIISDDDSSEVSQEGIKLLIILVDGFRWDYVSLDKSLKGFPKIAENGVRAKYVKPIFPANSYPNWYAIVTGLYGESHGMFENYMYDETRDDFFLMTPHPNASHPHWWNQSEPIWINAQENGVKTAMYLWDGCQVRIEGVRPSICHKYRAIYEAAKADNQTRTFINTILDDFAADKYRLALVYHELVDHNGHEFGPRGRRTKQAIRDIDDIINDLYDEIEERKMSDDLNVVIVSDHGMISKEGITAIHIERVIDFNDVEIFLGGGSIAQILPEEGKEEQVYQQLRQASVKGLNVYRKDNIPERFHFNDHKNVLPILLTVDEGFMIFAPRIKSKVYPDYERDEDDIGSGGGHGYDPEHVEEMRAIMYGFGPAFRKNYVSEPLAQVDHYNLFCHLLDIDPKPNNGSMARIERLLKEAESEEDSEESDEDESEAAEQTDDDDDDDGVTANKLHSTLIYMIVLQVFYLVINKLV